MPGRNFFFWTSVPYFCRVGPTVCRVTEGSGTSARVASLVKICCSMWPKPLPPYSVGQPTPSQPSRPIRLMISSYVFPWRVVPMSAASSGEMSVEKYSRSSAWSARWAGVRSMNASSSLVPTPPAPTLSTGSAATASPSAVSCRRGPPTKRARSLTAEEYRNIG